MEKIELTTQDWLRLENLQLRRKLHELLAENLAFKHQAQAADFAQQYEAALQELAKLYAAEELKFDPAIKGWMKSTD